MIREAQNCLQQTFMNHKVQLKDSVQFPNFKEIKKQIDKRLKDKLIETKNKIFNVISVSQ
jgi:hypothetical protein